MTVELAAHSDQCVLHHSLLSLLRAEELLQTWASLVDEAALVDLPDSERKRQEACYELIATEQSYVQSLQLVIEVRSIPLALETVESVHGPSPARRSSSTASSRSCPRRRSRSSSPTSTTSCCSTRCVLLPYRSRDGRSIDPHALTPAPTQVFVSELEERQRQARLYIDTIGDVLKEHMRGVVRHYRLFCVNQANAMRTLDDLKMSNAPVRETLDVRPPLSALEGLDTRAQSLTLSTCSACGSRTSSSTTSSSSRCSA